MTTKDNRKGFEEAIRANPLDPNIHLIYADWLEEQGLDVEGHGRRLLGTVLADPYNSDLRSKYGDWLDGRGHHREARQERWLSGAIRGKVPEGVAVITRQGVTAVGTWDGGNPWSKVPVPVLRQKTAWLNRAAEKFKDDPSILF